MFGIFKGHWYGDPTTDPPPAPSPPLDPPDPPAVPDLTGHPPAAADVAAAAAARDGLDRFPHFTQAALVGGLSQADVMGWLERAFLQGAAWAFRTAADTVRLTRELPEARQP